MFRKQTTTTAKLHINESIIGEPLARKIERALSNGEVIPSDANITYTERKDGVIPDYDIRTDKMDIAREAAGTINKMNIARREQAIGERTYDSMTPSQQEAFKVKYPNAKIPQGGKTEG